MKFRVGCYAYTVRITDDQLVDDDGAELAGRAIWNRREILIAGCVPASQRLEVLLHEIKHCWLKHVPWPRSEEDLCNLTAMVAESVMEDLDQQGGVRALMQLKPPAMFTEPEPTEPIEAPPVAPDASGEDGGAFRYVPVDQVEDHETAAMATGGRGQCGCCETIIADGSIISGPARWEARSGGVVMARTLYCPHCHHLQDWVEGTNAGTPNGAIVRGPTYRKGAEVDQFLEKHRKAVGMLAG